MESLGLGVGQTRVGLRAPSDWLCGFGDLSLRLEAPSVNSNTVSYTSDGIKIDERRSMEVMSRNSGVSILPLLLTTFLSLFPFP